MKLRLYIICLALHLIAVKGQGQLVIKELHRPINVKNHIFYLEDKKNAFNFNEVTASKDFKRVESNIPNFGISNSSFWLKLIVKNKSEKEDFLLEIGQPGLDEVDFYHPNSLGVYQLSKGGEILPFGYREFFDPNYIFRVKLHPNQETVLYFKVRARDNIQVPITIGTQESIFEVNKIKDILVGIFFGIMLVMFFYNAFLFFTVKDKLYLYYILYLVTVIITQGSILGYTYQYLWPNLPVLARYSSFIFPPLVGMASILFIRVFLRTRLFFPKYDKYFRHFLIAYTIASLFSVFGFFELSFKLIESCAICVSMYMLWIAYRIYKKGYRPALFFLLAWTIFLTGVSIYVMKDLGVLPYNAFTNYMMPLGSAMEVVLLSFALADRINMYKEERKKSQAEALAALRANEKLIKEQNILLEKKVQERTLELEDKNSELGIALTDLKNAQSQLVVVEKMASLGQLTAGIAHEINNPINFVKANIQPLQLDITDILNILQKYEGIENEENLTEKLADIEKLKTEIDLDYVKQEIDMLLNGIADGANRTAEIVRGLKNFSHLDESDIQDSNLNEGIESTMVLLKSTIPKNIKVVKNLGELPKIECYPGKLNQVLMNIINNAIQAMEKYEARSEHTLTISSFFKDEKVHICVEDTGMGMTEEVKQRVFEPFFTTKTIGEGTGLGMSIVFGIIESHKAKIDIDSTPDVGTKITLILNKTLA